MMDLSFLYTNSLKPAAGSEKATDEERCDDFE